MNTECFDGSRRIVNIDEHMLQPPLRCHAGGYGRCAVTLSGMVASGNVGHPRFARQMGLWLRNLPGHKGIGTGGNRRFKIALRATGRSSVGATSVALRPKT